MNMLTNAERATALEARIHAHIPLARAMQVRIESFDGECVTLTAPLEANINDKGTGFAGSLATLVTLAGWSLATLVGESCGEPCEAAVYHSELDFLRPVRETLRAQARLADAQSLAQIHERLRAGKRAKLAVVAQLGPAEDKAVIFAGNYAVWRTGTQPF